MNKLQPPIAPTLVPRRKALREHLGCSPVTAWRRERQDPDWPRALLVHGRIFYRADEIARYIETRASNTSGMPQQMARARGINGTAEPAAIAADAGVTPRE